MDTVAFCTSPSFPCKPIFDPIVRCLVGAGVAADYHRNRSKGRLIAHAPKPSDPGEPEREFQRDQLPLRTNSMPFAPIPRPSIAASSEVRQWIGPVRAERGLKSVGCCSRALPRAPGPPFEYLLTHRALVPLCPSPLYSFHSDPSSPSFAIAPISTRWPVSNLRSCPVLRCRYTRLAALL